MLPTGFICLWYGSIVSIPDGWVLCDGNNSTPDLRNKFLVGAGDTYAVGANGGNINHNHDFTGNGHQHTMAAGFNLGAGIEWGSEVSVAVAAGTTDNENGLPPYHSLAYIMKT